jgi:peptidoglycan/LPS O-acetylase OafA/YrhL
LTVSLGNIVGTLGGANFKAFAAEVRNIGQGCGAEVAPMPRRDDHLPALDGARGIAALAVLIYHLKDFTGGSVLFRGSFLAVDLFFLMSGYVICLSYENRLRDGRCSFWSFVRARVVRLYPLYLLACAIGFAYFLIKAVQRLEDAPSYAQLASAIPSSLAVLPSPTASTWGFTSYPFAPSSWSLSFELWFNFVYALLVVRFRSVYLVGIAACSLGVLAREALNAGTLDLGYDMTTLIGGMARFWLSFTLGVLLCRWRHQLRTPRLPGWSAAIMVLAMAFVLLPHNALVLDLAWVTVIFPAALVVAVRQNITGLAAKVCDHFGRLSYGIYILHAPTILFLTGVIKVALGEAWDDHLGLLATGEIGAVLVLASLATYLFDEPVRRRLRSRPTPVSPVGPMAGAGG